MKYIAFETVEGEVNCEFSMSRISTKDFFVQLITEGDEISFDLSECIQIRDFLNEAIASRELD